MAKESNDLQVRSYIYTYNVKASENKIISDEDTPSHVYMRDTALNGSFVSVARLRSLSFFCVIFSKRRSAREKSVE